MQTRPFSLRTRVTDRINKCGIINVYTQRRQSHSCASILLNYRRAYTLQPPSSLSSPSSTHSVPLSASARLSATITLASLSFSRSRVYSSWERESVQWQLNLAPVDIDDAGTAAAPWAARSLSFAPAAGQVLRKMVCAHLVHNLWGFGAKALPLLLYFYLQRALFSFRMQFCNSWRSFIYALFLTVFF